MYFVATSLDEEKEDAELFATKHNILTSIFYISENLHIDFKREVDRINQEYVI